MRKSWKLVAVAGVAAIVATLGGAQAAHAAPPEGYGTSTYGYDGKIQPIVGGGSDTTYRAESSITDLFQLSGLNGCAHNTAAGTTQGQCQTDLTNSNLGNYDGDNFSQNNPTGSGGGVRALNGVDNSNAASAGLTQQGAVNPIVNPTRTDSVTTTNADPVVLDASITANDRGKSVVGTGIPKASYVGTVTVGTSFRLSSAPSEQLDVNATAAGTVNAVIQPYDCVGAQANPEPDMARSSAGAVSPSGGKASCGDELRADTFFGYAQDGISVTGFNHHGDLLNGLTGATHLSPEDLQNIWSCQNGTGTGGRQKWSDIIPGLAPADDAEIVPWKMNTSSGTYNVFRDYVRNNSTLANHGTFDPNTSGACSRGLTGGGVPLENDVKFILNDGTLSTVATSVDNPENWMWWGSFGVFSAFPYTSTYSRPDGSVHTTWVAKSAAIKGITPGTGNILQLTYPISRTLFHVNRKADADCVKTQQVSAPFALTCDFNGHAGPSIPSASTTDLNIVGGTSSVSGAVREYARFLCRKDTTQQGTDPFTGLNFDTEITAAINGTGFTTIKTAVKTPGSRCVVVT